MESGDYLRFKEEVRPYLKVLKTASQTIIDQEVSKYPIFVLYKDSIELGIPLLEREEPHLKWFVNASTLEEFVAKQLISTDKVQSFKKTYRNPTTYLCVFVVTSESGEFVFLPKELTGAN